VFELKPRLDVRCAGCRRRRDLPELGTDARPMQGERVTVLDAAEPCPQCGAGRVRIEFKLG
jgi:hypothetical protein